MNSIRWPDRCLFVVALALLPAVAEAQAPAGCADPVYSGQDFTVGTWDVYTGTEKSAEVRMEKTLDGCAILETWRVPAGKKGNGIGLFVYSPLLKAWSYLWAADTASSTAFTGSIVKPGEIRYVTRKPLAGGKTRLRHWSLILQGDGTVRELAVGSEDEGATWTTEYDLKWVKQRVATP